MMNIPSAQRPPPIRPALSKPNTRKRSASTPSAPVVGGIFASKVEKPPVTVRDLSSLVKSEKKASKASKIVENMGFLSKLEVGSRKWTASGTPERHPTSHPTRPASTAPGYGRPSSHLAPISTRYGRSGHQPPPHDLGRGHFTQIQAENLQRIRERTDEVRKILAREGPASEHTWRVPNEFMETGRSEASTKEVAVRQKALEDLVRRVDDLSTVGSRTGPVPMGAEGRVKEEARNMFTGGNMRPPQQQQQTPLAPQHQQEYTPAPDPQLSAASTWIPRTLGEALHLIAELRGTQTSLVVRVHDLEARLVEADAENRGLRHRTETLEDDLRSLDGKIPGGGWRAPAPSSSSRGRVLVASQRPEDLVDTPRSMLEEWNDEGGEEVLEQRMLEREQAVQKEMEERERAAVEAAQKARRLEELARRSALAATMATGSLPRAAPGTAHRRATSASRVPPSASSHSSQTPAYQRSHSSCASQLSNRQLYHDNPYGAVSAGVGSKVHISLGGSASEWGPSNPLGDGGVREGLDRTGGHVMRRHIVT